MRRPSVGAGGTPTPPGFEAHPERINRKGTDIKKSPRYQLEQMMDLTADEVAEIANNPDAPLFSRRLARSLLKENKWDITERMINQVYGKPKETIETTDNSVRSIKINIADPLDLTDIKPRKTARTEAIVANGKRIKAIEAKKEAEAEAKNAE